MNQTAAFNQSAIVNVAADSRSSVALGVLRGTARAHDGRRMPLRFGPLETSNYRNRINKRYGVLWTCLTSRAVFVDLADSLSSEDFLLAFQRFAAIYFAPVVIYSDNGRNFIGAEKEFTSSVADLEKNEVSSFFRTSRITWRFQPPEAPHFGGAHESLVKSSKQALHQMLRAEASTSTLPNRSSTTNSALWGHS